MKPRVRPWPKERRCTRDPRCVSIMHHYGPCLVLEGGQLRFLRGDDG